MRVLISRDLEGRTVIDGAGRAVGTIEHVLVDTEGWAVAGFRVKLRREIADELGESHGAFRSATIDVPIQAVHAAGDAVILQIPVAGIRHGDQQEHAT
jgi:sporulation protein YlmC with PRC-barrel domain